VKLKNAIDVSRWRLCVGCGACAYACEKKNIVLEDIPDQGIRPKARGAECDECGKCLEVCPGLGAAHSSMAGNGSSTTELTKKWGPILEVWEGHAVDPGVRYRASSGGIATAIGLYCLEAGRWSGVLHIGMDEAEPWRNKTVLSRTREDLLSRSGSRYSPASPCDGLEKVENESSPCVFIGKPCDIQGFRKAEVSRPRLEGKSGLAIGIFCAGTPATAGLMNLLRRIHVSPEDVGEVRFRGNGWPGSFAVRLKGKETFSQPLSYQESWGFLQAYRPFRCYLCPDGTSQFADISCGDPWYRKMGEKEQGHSLVLVRTEKGRKVVQGAIREGYVALERRDPQVLEESQQNLLEKRRAIWGRLAAMKALRIPAPEMRGFYLFDNWRRLPAKEKARSILGTARRIIQRGYFRPMGSA
jgi:coenzyme F420 hydrogenase subunit beta